MNLITRTLTTEHLSYNEPTLLQRIAEGDQAAFAQLVALYSSLLYKQALRLLKNNELAEEVVQDVFVQLWQVRETLPEVNNIRNYLFVIAKGYTIDALRKSIRARESYQRWKAEQSPEVQIHQPVDNSLHIIDQALHFLSPQQQKVWVMSRRLRMKYEDIAATLGISRDAVNKYLQAANKNIIRYIRQHKDLIFISLLWILSKK